MSRQHHDDDDEDDENGDDDDDDDYDDDNEDADDDADNATTTTTMMINGTLCRCPRGKHWEIHFTSNHQKQLTTTTLASSMPSWINRSHLSYFVY